MPRENKKRGKRGGENNKRKIDEIDGEDLGPTKRTRTDDGENTSHFADNQDYEDLGEMKPTSENIDNVENPVAERERVFYGMLDEEEQEYFKKADDLLEADAFGDADEKNLFLANVFIEADGKELKLACSQSCSRLMEKLIQLSSPAQLSKLFQKFNGHFLNLIQHRFASHCCEKLFIKAAPVVTSELLKKPGSDIAGLDNGEVYVSMENLFLYTVTEFEGNLGFLITDRFGSHALRVLLLVLAGEPLTSQLNKSVMQSKRKENVEVSSASKEEQTNLSQQRPVPKSFSVALEKMMADCVTGLHTQGLRALASHPLGSPILQLLVRLELTHFGKSRAKDESSIYRGLLPEDPVTQETESAAFMNGLNYDPIGSHLLESVIEHVPGKTFKGLYKEFWKSRLASLSRNEVAMYVVCKLLERLGKDDLIEAHEAIISVLPLLLDRNRIAVLRTLIERCAVRNVDTQAIAAALEAYYNKGDGFDLLKLLAQSSDVTGKEEIKDKQLLDDHSGSNSIPLKRNHINQVRVQGSILAQTMLLVPGPLSGLIFDSICNMATADLVAIARDPVASRTLQAILTSTNGSIVSRRKLVQQFYGEVGTMAIDLAASHVVDAIWEGTHGLAFIRERIAEELADTEDKLRESPCGRAVWKNWKMDLYKRRRHEWVRQSRNKASNDGFQSFDQWEDNKSHIEDASPQKDETNSSHHAIHHSRAKQHLSSSNRSSNTSIAEARERHAQRKEASRQKREQVEQRRRRTEAVVSA